MRTTPAETEQTNQRIIEAAVKVFSKLGYESANMRDIADEANISRGPLYYRYKTKSELFLAALRVSVEREIASYQRIFYQNKHILDMIREDLYYCTRGLRLEQTVFPVVISDDPALVDAKRLDRRLRETIYSIKLEAVERAIQKGELKPDTDPQQVVDLMFILYDGLRAMSQSDDQPMDCGRITNAIENIVYLFRVKYFQNEE